MGNVLPRHHTHAGRDQVRRIIGDRAYERARHALNGDDDNSREEEEHHEESPAVVKRPPPPLGPAFMTVDTLPIRHLRSRTETIYIYIIVDSSCSPSLSFFDSKFSSFPIWLPSILDFVDIISFHCF